MKVVFIASRHEFVRNAYIRYSDRFELSDEEVAEVLSYKNISEKFTYSDYFGWDEEIVASLVEVKECPNWLEFHVKVDKSIPARYCPSPSDILKGKGLLYPVVYHIQRTIYKEGALC